MRVYYIITNKKMFRGRLISIDPVTKAYLFHINYRYKNGVQTEFNASHPYRYISPYFKIVEITESRLVPKIVYHHLQGIDDLIDYIRLFI